MVFVLLNTSLMLLACGAREELNLAEYKQLSPEELAEVHSRALGLEKHAYQVSSDVYG